MKIIGLSGTNGAGKDSVGEMLAERQNFLFIPATDMLREEAHEKGIEPTREALRTISSQWREKYGPGAVIDVAIERHRKEIEAHAGLAIASLRHPGEADRVHTLGGVVVWVDADPRVRYERVAANAEARGRAAEDKKTYEEFLEEQAAEMDSKSNAAGLSIAEVKAKADISLENNGNDIEAFKDEAEKSLSNAIL